MFHRKNRRGFTLPEVLVTVAIIAVLAAVVVPAVTQQVSKGDAPAFISTVNGIRTALTTFVSDTRRIPGKLDHLQDSIATTDDDLFGTAYTQTAVNAWKGPYDNSGVSDGVISVGYGWKTDDALKDTANYVVVVLTKASADTTDAHELDVAIDGGNGGGAGIVRYDPDTDGSGPLTPANKIWLFLMSSAH
jgi:prepilin-type N-terminal cleavage/methylation domain-containing protein